MINFISMRHKEKIISLKKWPTEPKTQECKYRLSPLTSKILNTTNIDYHDVLPITIQQFMRTFEVYLDSKSDFITRYHEEVELRQKRVQLLKALWEKMNKKKNEFSNRSSSSLIQSKGRISKIMVSYHDLSRTLSKRKKKSKSPSSPLIFKANSKKKNINTEYFSDYDKQAKHNSNTDESTKSKQAISKNKSKKVLIPNDDYFEHKVKVKNRKPKNEKELKEDLNLKLEQLVSKWGELYEKHTKQEEKAGQLEEKERKRLQKMHEIQKLEVKEKIQSLSRKIYDETKHKL